MSAKWPLVKLGEVLDLDIDAVDVNPMGLYAMAGVYSFGRGLFRREPLPGAETTYRRLHRLHAGQIVLSQLKAWEGAIALVAEAFNGSHLSPQFPTFRVRRDKADSVYVAWYLRSPTTWEHLRRSARGMGARRDSVSPQSFLSLDIPLPPLPEQQRIVSRLAGLDRRIGQMRSPRYEGPDEVSSLVAAEELRIWPNSSVEDVPLLDGLTLYLARGRQSKQGQSDHYLVKTQHVQMGSCVRSNLTLAPEVAEKVVPEARLKNGDILIACSAAGCLGRVARWTVGGMTASTDTHVAIARANEGVVEPDYLYAYLKGAQGQIQLRSREKGDWTREKVGFRLTELNVADLRRVPVPVPSRAEQRRIVAYLAKLQSKTDGVLLLKAAREREIQALMPSILERAFIPASF